jgi:hypothetical protein
LRKEDLGRAEVIVFKKASFFKQPFVDNYVDKREIEFVASANKR